MLDTASRKSSERASRSRPRPPSYVRSTRPVEVTREVGCALAALVLNRAMVNSPEFVVRSLRREAQRREDARVRNSATDFSQMLYPLSYADPKSTTGVE